MAKSKIKSAEPKKIFINCPYDPEYKKLLYPMIFTVFYLGYEPLIAAQTIDSGQVRLHRILDLIKESDLSIHDISRLEENTEDKIDSDKKKDTKIVFRLNMPFELGIDWGFRYFTNKGKDKPFLVLVASSSNIHRAISDFSGCDPERHNNNPEDLISAIRDWIISLEFKSEINSASKIWYDYQDFYADLYKKPGFKKQDIEKMKTPELKKEMKKWIQDREK